MADLTLSPDTTDDTDGGPDRASTTRTRPRTPHWVKVIGITLLVLILMLVIMMLFGGNHGPGRHISSRITEFGMQALAWGIEPR